jgi:hypothetical protein
MKKYLYSPYSILTRFGELEPPITMHWFVAGRKESIIPFEDAIGNYSLLSSVQKRKAERIILEMMTKREFLLVRQTIAKIQHWTVFPGRIVLPVYLYHPRSSTQGDMRMPFIETESKVGQGIIRLDEDEAYDLPFTVWGAFFAPKEILRANFSRPGTTTG